MIARLEEENDKQKKENMVLLQNIDLKIDTL